MDLNKIYKEELITQFKFDEYSSYIMYKNNGLTDDDIVKLLENSLSDLFPFLNERVLNAN